MQALEIATVDDLVRVLDDHPQWLEALRQRLLTREVLDLPQQLADFAAATERRFEVQGRQLEAQGRQLEGLTGQVEVQGRQLEAQGRQLGGLAGKVEAQGHQIGELTDRLGKVECQVEAHGHQIGELTDRLDKVECRLGKVECRLGSVEGQLNKLRDDIGPIKAAHVSNAARRLAYRMAEKQGLELVDILEWKDLGAMVQSSDTHGISDGDLESFRIADMVLRATGPDGSECYVAVEVSYTANGRDTRRAIRNAQFLTRFTGLRSYAVVAGLRFDNRILEAVESGAVAWFELPAEVLEVN